MKITSAEHLEKSINPNVFITLTLKQGYVNEKGSYIPGGEIVYARAMRGLMRDLNQRCFPKRAFRRNPSRIKNLTCLEFRFGSDYHVHACVRKPDNVSFEEFERHFEESWRNSKWYRPNYKIEEYRGGGVAYILKEGQDAILLPPSVF